MPGEYAGIIRRARTRAGLSQRELARRAGTSQAVISAYENAQREPGFDRLEAVIAAAGFDLRVDVRPAATARASRQPWHEADDYEDDDRILENLRLTPSQRLRKMGALRGFTSRYRGALARRR